MDSAAVFRPIREPDAPVDMNMRAPAPTPVNSPVPRLRTPVYDPRDFGTAFPPYVPQSPDYTKRPRSVEPMDDVSPDHAMEKRMRKAYQDGQVIDCTCDTSFAI